MEWRDTVTDTKALFSGVTSDMNVYAAYTESITYTTKLTLEYYTVVDLEKVCMIQSLMKLWLRIIMKI